MEKWADDSRDCGHHWGHLGNCDSALYHRCSVLLSASGTYSQKMGKGTRLGWSLKGGSAWGAPKKTERAGVQDIVEEGTVRLQGRWPAMGLGGVSVQFSDQLPSSLKAFAEAQRDSRALQWHTATLQESSSQERAALPSLPCLSFRAF